LDIEIAKLDCFGCLRYEANLTTTTVEVRGMVIVWSWDNGTRMPLTVNLVPQTDEPVEHF
jgi:hypothetical protein